MSDDLIARRAPPEQQGCESERSVLTINRCGFKHDFSADTHMLHTARATAGTRLAFVLLQRSAGLGRELYDHLYPPISWIRAEKNSNPGPHLEHIDRCLV